MKFFRQSLCMAAVLLAMLLSGCRAGSGGPGGAPGPGGIAGAGKEEPHDRLKVAATLFPYYDFTRQIAGDLVELTMVIPAGMDSHSFEPTPADMMAIENADVLVCNGGSMEHWLFQVLDALEPSALKVMVGMDHVDAVEEVLVEGMEEGSGHGEEDHGHGEEDDAYGEEEEGGFPHLHVDELDEHIWTSPANAISLVEAIRDTLSEADPAHRAEYEANAADYMEELKKLDQEFKDVVSAGKRRMIIIGDKFSFRYFADQYGLSYRAAFSGCSTDTEPSAHTIAYLIDQMKKEGIPVIYYPELTSRRVAEVISEETGAKPLLLHSCHNVTRKEFDSGVTYLGLMKGNVENLRKGLTE